mmetsp:Transcript_8393/g.16870  ORF Transcript_8393/g.16870 Transcript_8393/m.16870 type:complete len:193 (-) Transcript_8393:98-676(-)|eukprot:CAMPEP_0119077016 /NCGR_PEP_ID=MMETSP1178-20130426/91732_1 /TAXON_ID=33656 /ORGANISM="unid sp, Strain CCMP2000" /LENGTH=192 /DNA_ID=CAMNT_0007059345 /DNA_START=22 /DNA_END=600 /DNA_ORIENTATION=+
MHPAEPAALVEAAAEAATAPAPYVAPLITPPTPEELRLAEARKQMLRALDTKITQQDDKTALAAIELLEKIVSNILSQPDEPKYRQFKASNPTISKKLLKVPGGREFINAAGFSTAVVQFEEVWQLLGSGIELAVLEQAQEGLGRYKALVHERLQKRETAREERKRGVDKDKELILQQIEADKSDRKDKSWR